MIRDRSHEPDAAAQRRDIVERYADRFAVREAKRGSGLPPRVHDDQVVNAQKPAKASSKALAALGARYLNFNAEDVQKAASTLAGAGVLAEDIRALAGSVLVQA